jgi:hypothetical protein
VSALGEVKEDWMERTARQKARASHSSSTTVGRRGDGCCVDDDALVIGAGGRGRSEVGRGTGDAMLLPLGFSRGEKGGESSTVNCGSAGQTKPWTDRENMFHIFASQYDRRSLLWQKIVRIGRRIWLYRQFSRHNSSKVPQNLSKV